MKIGINVTQNSDMVKLQELLQNQRTYFHCTQRVETQEHVLLSCPFIMT